MSQLQKKYSTWLFGAGVVIAIVTHVYMLLAGLPAEQVFAHAVLNLIAAGLLLFAWWKK